MSARLERERTQFQSWRSGKGRARVAARPAVEDCGERLEIDERGYARIVRAPVARVSVSGAAIVIDMHPLSKDMRKAFVHYCGKNEIRLVPCERNRDTVRGVNEGETVGNLTTATAFVAWGAPQALFMLSTHKYVRNYAKCTDAKAPRDLTRLAPAPRKKGKDDVPADDAAGLKEVERDAEREREEIAESTREAREWYAENVEEAGDAEHEIRECLREWFRSNSDGPESLEALGAWADENVEWV